MIYEQYFDKDDNLRTEIVAHNEIVLREIEPEKCGLVHTGVYAAVEQDSVSGKCWALLWCVKRSTGNLERFGSAGSYATLDDAQAYITRRHGR